MKRSRRGKITQILVVMLLLLVAGLSYHLVSRPRSLLDGATLYRAVIPTESLNKSRVLTPSSVSPPLAPRNSVVPAPSNAWTDYAWLDDNTIRRIDSSTAARQLQEIDVTTGAVKACALHPSKPGIHESIALDKLSPDGRWITAEVSLWSPTRPEKGKTHHHI